MKPQPIYSGMNTLYEENTTGVACYIYGPQGLLAKRTTINEESSMFYYHTDHLGTRLVTDENKNIVSATTYHPNGEITGKAFKHSMNRIGLVSVQEISKKWIQGWKMC